VKAILVAIAMGLSITLAQGEDWTTTDGKKYEQVKVIRVEDDAVTILYKDGGVLIFLYKLPPALQQRFDYDPVKAKAAMDARAKADAENAKALQAEIELANKLKLQRQILDANGRTHTNAPPQ
jgi:hypothetical protein